MSHVPYLNNTHVWSYKLPRNRLYEDWIVGKLLQTGL